MKKDDIKTLTNMASIMPKIKNKRLVLEEDFFNLYNIICGYRKIRVYFHNSTIIEEILDKQVDNITIFDLLRYARNRYCHLDKHNQIDSVIILQTEVDKNDLDRLITEIDNGIENIYKTFLNNDSYKVIMNSKETINFFELAKHKVNDGSYLNETDRKSKEILKQIINNFEYDNSTIEDFNQIGDVITNMFKDDEQRESMIDLYGKDNYKDMLRMIEDENFSDEDTVKLMQNIKDYRENHSKKEQD